MNVYKVGLDIGSTTTKMVVLDKDGTTVLFSGYKRHQAKIQECLLGFLYQIKEQLGDIPLSFHITGSVGMGISEKCSLPFVQEVVAATNYVRREHPHTATMIDIGGEDAKVVFFQDGQATDLRMNGNCAGGTGAFIDQMAILLGVSIDELNELALRSNQVYSIASRCGVFCKTDIQNLIAKNISKENIAASIFHAVAVQTTVTLARGCNIVAPVLFCGGPLTFIPALRKAFANYLNLSQDTDFILPEKGNLIPAWGAALAENNEESIHLSNLIQVIENKLSVTSPFQSDLSPIFDSEEEYRSWKKEKDQYKIQYASLRPGLQEATIGIDSGSTTTKIVVLDNNHRILYSYYHDNNGNPIKTVENGLQKLYEECRRRGTTLRIKGGCSTGYGEDLIKAAFHMDAGIIETIAHYAAAKHISKEVSFILDIGGQDMKAIWIDNGIITNIVVNEACSSGCGSFLENFASSLHIPVEEIAEAAFSSKHPASLGSRCTVFMNSSIVTEQRNGKQSADIMAGLCRSIIENVFTKVIRISNLDSLGDKIVVQGGTFRNDAVLRALEQYTGREVIRAPYPGIMGAIGAALITKKRFEQNHPAKTFIGIDGMADFSYTQEANAPCPFCANHCKRTIVRFSNGNSWVTNNRCERGEILGDPKDASVRQQLEDARKSREQTPNLFKLRQELLFKDYPYPKAAKERDITIGLPRVLSYWETMPFWTTFWRALGFKIQLSDLSTRKIYEDGLSAVTSDTVCFPAKLVHGHLRNLVKKGVDRIFMPSITTVTSENTESTSESMCAIVKGYPIVIRNSDNPEKRWHIPFDAPLFHWYKREDRNRQLTGYMEKAFGISPAETRQAINVADAAEKQFHDEMHRAGKAVLDEVTANGSYAVVLASRPYQNDALVNHDLPEMFTSLGIPVLTADSLEEADHVDLSMSRLDIVNNYHARMLSTAILAARNPHLEYVQIVSFGCGHDAYLSDEIVRMIGDVVKAEINDVIDEGQTPAEWNLLLLNRTLLPIAPIKPLSMNKDDYKGYTTERLIDEVTEQVKELYAKKEQEITEETGSAETFREVERVFLLKVIDNKWMSHIDDMDQLRQSISLQAYAQKDPVVEYRYAGIEMFEEMIAAISKDIVMIMLHIRKKPEVERKQEVKVTGTNKDDSGPKKPVQRKNKKVQPNDPCPCGKCYPDGRPIKYKNCCGRNQ